MIPQSDPEHQHLVDVLIQSAQRIEYVTQEDGSVEKQLMLDPKSIYYKTLIVASPHLARLVLELENFSNLALQVYNFMSKFKADAMSAQIKELVTAYQYSIDSKSSESIRENGSAQSTYIDKISRNKIERSYQVKGEKSRSFLDAMMGKDKEEDMDND